MQNQYSSQVLCLVTHKRPKYECGDSGQCGSHHDQGKNLNEVIFIPWGSLDKELLST
jgi:hypothetical protein